MKRTEAHRSYEYPVLTSRDSTRLLELLPGTAASLGCRLHPVALSQKPPFEALSYTWGKPEFPHKLHEATSNANFRITDNLRDALLELRLPDATRWLWVDAVCINQADEAEKGRQVSMMKEIYQSACKVIVWLGKEATNPEAAKAQKNGFSELKNIGRNCTLYGFDKIYPPFPRVVKDHSAFEHLKQLAREGDGLKLLGIYQRDWYERVWIVQEFVLAQDLVLRCGSLSISYDLFSKATAVFRLITRRPSILVALNCNTKGLMLVLMDSGFNNAWRLIQQRERYWGLEATQFNTASGSARSVYAYEDPFVRPSSIIEYCAFAKGLKCAYEVDRFYGMLGFAHDSLAIGVDYSSAPEKVWEDLARKSLVLGDLTVLHYAGIPARGESKVQSFAADFGHWSDETTRLGGHGYPRFHSATQIPAKVELEPNGSMRVHAIKVDTVNQVGFVYERAGAEPDAEATKHTANSSVPDTEAYEDATAQVELLLQSNFVAVTREMLDRLYKWWMYCLEAEGPRFYNHRMGELAFRRSIIADNALPKTQQLNNSMPLDILDLMFVIFMLAEDVTGEDGVKKKVVDTWKVYRWMKKPIVLGLRTFADDEFTTKYYFPTIYGIGSLDDLWHSRYSETEYYDVTEVNQAFDLLGINCIVPDMERISGVDKIIEITNPLKDQLDNYMMAISSILSDRLLFFTNVRLLGIGPKGTRPGDVVMVPEGSQTPFIYRPTLALDDLDGFSGCERKGQLVGECYIHGLMDGDPVERLQEDYDESHIEVILV